MLRDTGALVVSIAAAPDYASQTGFAAAFRRLTDETPSNWDNAHVNSNRSATRSIALEQLQAQFARSSL
jgi:AraC-like DNA-binding protein